MDPLAELSRFDTPTVCNALEAVQGFFVPTTVTSRSLRCLYPELPAVVGYARTATIRSAGPARDVSAAAAVKAAYYEYVSLGTAPTIVVIEDLDGDEAGRGCLWGEINTTLHQRLGCAGVVTNGAVRDVPLNAPGFQMLCGEVVPARGYTHVTGFGVPVSVAGMAVEDGDLVHADQHGAVVVPPGLAGEVVAAAERLGRQEKVLLAALHSPTFSIQSLPGAFKAAAEVR